MLLQFSPYNVSISRYHSCGGRRRGCTSYVPLNAHPPGVMLTRLVLVAEAQGKIEPRIPAYIERQRETVHIVAGQV